MTIDVIDAWLKTTIPGIVLLGAVGSIVAAIAIWLAHRFLFPYLIKGLVHSVAKVLSRFAGSAATQIARFILKNGEDKLSLFYTFQIMKLVLALFVSTCCFVLFALAVIDPSQDLVRSAVLVPLVLSFLTLWYGLRCIAIVRLPLYVNIQSTVESAKKEVLAKRVTKR
jgi:hypothetical protein